MAVAATGLTVAIALLVDPADESVLIFRPDAVPVARSGPEQIDLGDILPSFALTVEELFDTLRVYSRQSQTRDVP